jgi:hypothetical protein
MICSYFFHRRRNIGGMQCRSTNLKRKFDILYRLTQKLQDLELLDDTSIRV